MHIGKVAEDGIIQVIKTKCRKTKLAQGLGVGSAPRKKFYVHSRKPLALSVPPVEPELLVEQGVQLLVNRVACQRLRASLRSTHFRLRVSSNKIPTSWLMRPATASRAAGILACSA